MDAELENHILALLCMKLLEDMDLESGTDIVLDELLDIQDRVERGEMVLYLTPEERILHLEVRPLKAPKDENVH